MATKIYDLGSISCSFLGIPIEDGFGENSAIKIERLRPDYESKEGADGEITRFSTGSKKCKITITLMQTSSGNAALATINQLDVHSDNGAGVGPFMLKDKQGLSLFLAEKAWIVGPPAEAEYTNEVKEREWVLECQESQRFDGGN